MDLITIPIKIMSKPHKKTRYFPDKFLKGTLKLTINKGNQIHFDLIFGNSKRGYWIPISMYNILQMVMHRLKLRAIYPTPGGAKPWFNSITPVELKPSEMNDEEIFEAYTEANKHIEHLMPHLSEAGKIKAKEQWEDLIYAQRRIGLIEKIVKARAMQESDFQEK